jgi:uncharacterized C2H2 Zn-finger protein
LGMNTNTDLANHCKICGMAFIDKTRLDQHMDLVHKSLLFQCQSCNMVFIDKADFNNHMEIHYRFQNNEQ